MPPPKPLTQCDPPQLDWSRPGTPAASDFGDIYFSTDGGLEETETVFLAGCGLPHGWQNKERFVIGELGFGSGLNFLATWRLWDKTKTPNSRLHFVSIEKFPFDADQLTKALSSWPELKVYSDQLVLVWPGRVKGFHRLHFGDVTLTLIHDDISPALDELDAVIDAWFLDGFSPSKNPDMWSNDVMLKIAKLSAQHARLATFTVAGAVRTALQDAGFTTEKKEGFGRKRHRLEARFSGITKDQKSNITPTIVGAGIAGASLFKAFNRRGITPHIYHDPNHKAASHNAAALIKPRLDLQDRPESRFFLSSYLYALQVYEGFSIAKGVTHIPKNNDEYARFKKLISQAPLPPDHLTLTDKTLLLLNSLAINPNADIEVRGSGDVEMGDANDLRLKVTGSGDVDTGDVRSAEISVRGSGDVEIGDVNGPLGVESSGSSDVDIGNVLGDFLYDGRGSGDISVNSVTGRISVDIGGSGDASIDRGKASSLKVSASGASEFDFGGTAETADLYASGASDIYVNKVTGEVRRKESGAADIDID